MNHYAPREVADTDGKGTGRYRYTVSNRRTGTYAVGYCADGCDGHDTPEGACEHYKQYLLDTQLSLHHEMLNQQRPCRICRAWTSKFAQVGGSRVFILCDEHRTREHIETLFSVGEEWSSW